MMRVSPFVRLFELHTFGKLEGFQTEIPFGVDHFCGRDIRRAAHSFATGSGASSKGANSAVFPFSS
jgi:hypothetical protein